MKRRQFLQYSSLAAAGITMSRYYGFSQITSGAENKPQLITMRDCKASVIADVDVVVAGGSAAGIAAAVSAAAKGASVFVVAAEPYLGADICGTLRLWDIDRGGKTAFSQSLLNKGQVPEPLHVKKTLQDYLISNNIPFLLSSFVGGIITDSRNEIGGIVITNRSGEQIIKAKTIIDASENCIVSRLAGAKFREITGKSSEFRYTVVGNKPVSGLNYKSLPDLISNGKAYPVTEYSFQEVKKSDSFAWYQKLEQTIRDKTWDADQVDSSDILFEIPAAEVVCKTAKPVPFKSAELLPMEALQPIDSNRIFILNGYAGVNFEDKETMLLPGNMTALGERVGGFVAETANKLRKVNLTRILGRNINPETMPEGIISNKKTRPAFHLDTFKIASESLPILGTFDNLVVGGGTAGACAAISSARYGASTLVIEYLHGLGGIGTMGLIGRYWVGYREGFTKEIDEGVRKMAAPDHPRQKKNASDWVKDWKMEWYRREIQKAGGSVWFGALVCGAVVEKNVVKGVIVSTPFGKGAVLAKNVIDSTGSADVAIAAGALYEFIDASSVAVQGAGLPPVKLNDHYNNTDYTFTDDTDVLDVTRTMVTGIHKFTGIYDVGKLPQTRERRRIISDYRVTVMDMVNKKNYSDTISYHYSSFDTHGYTIDPYFIITPPADSSVNMFVNVPLRALLPKSIENIIVTGLGAGAERDAMPIIRMQPCLQNQGYSVGILAALAVNSEKNFRSVDFGNVQKEIVKLGILPKESANTATSYPPSNDQIRKAIRSISDKFDQIELVLWDRERGLKLLKEEFINTSDTNLKTKCAIILGFYGDSDACMVLVDEAGRFSEWDKGWNYRGMHQFGMSAGYLDGVLMALGKTGHKNGFGTIKRFAELLIPESELSHFRAVAEAFEGIGSKDAAPVLHKLLSMPGISGHHVTNLKVALTTVKQDTNDNTVRNTCLKELFLSRALFLCGDFNRKGKEILENYANDLHGPYAQHAQSVLNTRIKP
jgi:hypothetical protein